MTVLPIVVFALEMVLKVLEKKTGGIGNQMKNQDNPNYSIVEIGQNTEKNPGDWRRFVVTQIPVKDHQLTMVEKIHKE